MIIDFLLGVLTRNWKTALIATAIASCLGLLWFQASRLDAAKKELAQIEATAKAAQQQTEANLETIRQAVPLMVDAAQTNAVRNYLARHRATQPNNAGCNVSVGLRPEGSDGAPASTSEPAHPSGECVAPDPEFIKACARDAGRLMLWIELCKLNPLTCQVVE
jgi:hypothetical protein